MGFVLPRNSRQLRFTGEVKAQHAPAKADASAGTGALALGKPRVRKPPPQPPAARVQTPMPAVATRVSTPAPARRRRTPGNARDLYRHEPAPTPYIGSIDQPVLGYPPQGDFDDDQPTMAMDRDGRDVLPGARALRTPKPSPAAGAAPPIPHFRPAHYVPAAPRTVIVPGTASTKTETKTAGAPLAVWVFAGLLASIISYHIAPELVMPPEPPSAAAHHR